MYAEQRCQLLLLLLAHSLLASIPASHVLPAPHCPAALQGLAKSIAWDGEGATVLIECEVLGAEDDAAANKVCSWGGVVLHVTAWGPRDEQLGGVWTGHLPYASATAHSRLPFHRTNPQVAKSVVGSSLAKSAIFGHDPNWGRIAAAAG